MGIVLHEVMGEVEGEIGVGGGEDNKVTFEPGRIMHSWFVFPSVTTLYQISPCSTSPCLCFTTLGGCKQRGLKFLGLPPDPPLLSPIPPPAGMAEPRVPAGEEGMSPPS